MKMLFLISRTTTHHSFFGSAISQPPITHSEFQCSSPTQPWFFSSSPRWFNFSIHFVWLLWLLDYKEKRNPIILSLSPFIFCVTLTAAAPPLIHSRVSPTHTHTATSQKFPLPHGGWQRLPQYHNDSSPRWSVVNGGWWTMVAED